MMKTRVSQARAPVAGRCGAVMPVLLVVAACATAPPPSALMTLAQTAVAMAVSAGGATYAPAELALARDKLRRAQAALAEQRPEEAQMLAEQVQLDARVAEAKAQAERARLSAVAGQQGSPALREDMARPPTR